MATVTHTYGTATAITITSANSLASSATAGCKSTAFNFSNAPRGMIEVVLKVASGTIANDKGAHVWLARSTDGTNYDDGVTSADAAYTPNSPDNMMYLGFVSIPTQSLTVRKQFLIANPFPSMILVIRNYCGITTDSTGNSAQYRTITDTVA